MLPIADSPIARDGKVLILAMDHGMEHGPSDFREVPETLDPSTVFDIATHSAVTAIAVSKGVAEGYYPSYEDDVALVAKLNGTSNLWMGEPYSPKNWTVDYAAEVGADAVGYTIYGGSNHETRMFQDFREVQENAREHDLPVAMWAYPRGQGVKCDSDPDVIAYAARLGLELGADLAKVKYPGSPAAIDDVVDVAGGLPVVLSGGSKITDEEFLSLVETTMNAGGAGLAVGRNVWQRENPERILDALEKVIYEGASAEEALDD